MKPLIVANWKMNPKTFLEAKELLNSVRQKTKNIKKAEIVVCPPFVYMSLSCSPVIVGGQDCFWEQKGAYTGEVSPSMLKGLCKYVLLGHSERRRLFNETDEVVNKKMKLVIDLPITPILCVGETQEERSADRTEKVIKRQIVSDLEGISSAKFKDGVIAYEPVWAIGTGNPCDFEEAQKMGLLIRKIVSGIYGGPFSQKIRLLYGGSVNSTNARGYIKEAGFNGLLVGGASLDADEFVKIVKESV